MLAVTYNRRVSSIRIGLTLLLGPWLVVAPSPAFGEASTPPTFPSDVAADPLRDQFIHPPADRATRPLWFWNAPLSKSQTTEIMERSVASGYAGFGILPSENMKPAFMTPEFLDQYAHAVSEAARLHLKLCLYDEYWFPSGGAGGAVAKQFPQALNKRLDMLATDIQGPARFEKPLPPGDLMAAVAMNTQTLKRVNLTETAHQGRLTWDAPPGPWKVMVFTCVTDGARGLVDYLDPEAVGRFISLTYEKYYARFPEHFGTTIDSAFFDEPTMHWVQGGRVWTPAYNRKFRARFGYDPAPYYPALWFDIGPETAAARNALFGFRADLYADGFTRTINDWCRAHKIRLTGHQDQEEVVNPVGLCGDLMKCFRDQDIPGIDQIFTYGRASKAYKIVSSAAYNYDRPLVMTECYGAIKDMPVANLYKEAMDQFAKGINLMVPHAVWYDSVHITFPPELSYRSPTYGPALPAYNAYVARLQRMLQGGRHVADIGVLYPIATLQAGYYFGPGKPYEGGVTPPEADYMELGDTLALAVRRDFTFVHPDVLEHRCRVDGPTIRLNNPVNHEEYRVFVIPGSRTIGWATLARLKAFYEGGGLLLATTRLPDRSAEFGRDAVVRDAVAAMFGSEAAAGGAVTPERPFHVQVNPKCGRACFLPKPTREAIRAALDDAGIVYDVAFEADLTLSGGNLSTIHKVLDDGRQVYFFGNSSDTPVDTHVVLRGRLALSEWNPHDGRINTPDASADKRKGQDVTRLRLALPAVQSRFFVTGPE
jgi:hypothetical protein